ncbi:MAG: hypothetical protein ACRDPA_32400, partial [Solirubrobacteraceae bacterium]
STRARSGAGRGHAVATVLVAGRMAGSRRPAGEGTRLASELPTVNRSADPAERRATGLDDVASAPLRHE